MDQLVAEIVNAVSASSRMGDVRCVMTMITLPSLTSIMDFADIRAIMANGVSPPNVVMLYGSGLMNGSLQHSRSAQSPAV